jgi:hypothetical protein
VVDGVADRGGGTDDADLADPLGAHRVQVRVGLLDPHRVDVLHVGAGRDVVLRQVPAHEPALGLVDDGLLHQGHAEAHGHAADELRPGQRGIDDPPGGEDAEQARHPHLTGVGVHLHLRELGPERMTGEARIALDVLGRVRGPFAGLVLEQVLARLDHRGAPGRGAHRAAGQPGPRQVAVAELDPDPVRPGAQGLRRYLGQRGACAGADVGGGDLDQVAAGFRPDRGPRRLAPGRVGGRGHPGAGQPPAH